MKRNLSSRLVASSVLAIVCAATLIRSSEAQFLFTYEINQEDDSRAPKSSLFDPSSFRIVTPSQLQSSYQKLATQPIEAAPSSPSSGSAGDDSPSGSAPSDPAQQVSALAVTEPVGSRSLPSDDSTPVSSSGSSSLLKQTSAALQSFAELFSLSPSTSASPLGSNSLHPEPLNQQVDQQAEARSLHEHWTQQQQKSHQQTLGSLNQHHQQHLTPSVASSQQSSLANAALNSFTTTPTSNSLSQHHSSHHSPPASYWLTANPLNSPDGNYLVQIKQQQQQQQQPQVSSPASNMVDSLLSVGGRSNSQSLFPARPAKQSAQSSFLSTPTSYYPNPVESSTRVSTMNQQHLHGATMSGAHQAVPMDHFGAPATPVVPTQQQPRAASFVHTTAPSRLNLRDLSDANQQLQPPANAPEHFVAQHHAAPLRAPAHKSAEESLISFRSQQQSQHDQQSALFAAQQQLASQLQSNSNSNTNSNTNSNSNSNSNGQQHFRPALEVAQSFQPSGQQHHQLGEIPKVSPQIYESFLLQQRDQHEKHMELLKQQQELNKLLEQKHKQQETELKRKRKKEELDKEARKKAVREQEAARKLKLEQEERETSRRRRDEEERKRVLEERRFREYLEAREREKRERELKRQAEEEESKQRAEKERERELAEIAERRRNAELAAQEKRKREEEAAKYANYLRQQEELKKLLELKQKEDEAQQERRRQIVAAQQQQQHQQQLQPQPQQLQKHQHKHVQAMRANRLAAEHRERAGAGSSSSQWGTRGARGQPSTTSEPPISTSGSSGSSGSSSSESPVGRLSGPVSVASTSARSEPSGEQRPRARARQVVMVRQKNRNSSTDDKLIRQKIPLYSGPGQYGLYRGNNDSIASDLAALLDSVTLPTSTSTTTPPPSTTSVSSASSSTVDSEPSSARASRRFDGFGAAVTPTSESATARMSSSLSPLLIQSQQQASTPASLPVASNEQPPSEPFFDDDVPRRPARGLSSAAQRQQQRQSPSGQLAVASSRQQTSRLNESLSAVPPTSGGRSAHIGLASLPPDTDNDGIPGRAGVEYPILSAVPPTSFSCSKQPLNGYYADTETACQVVHLCQGGAQSSILCPNGTIFNQEKFSCQWWYEVNCSRAPIFYQLNDNLYKAPAIGDDAPGDSKRKPKSKQVERGANLLSV